MTEGGPPPPELFVAETPGLQALKHMTISGTEYATATAETILYTATYQCCANVCRLTVHHNIRLHVFRLSN